jgi:hypothetical protein
MQEGALDDAGNRIRRCSAFVPARIHLAKNDGYLSRDMFQIWPGTFGNWIWCYSELRSHGSAVAWAKPSVPLNRQAPNRCARKLWLAHATHGESQGFHLLA